jgi:hypothetical protein
MRTGALGVFVKVKNKKWVVSFSVEVNKKCEKKYLESVGWNIFWS